MKYALGLLAFLFPVHHHAPPPPPVVVTTTTTAPRRVIAPPVTTAAPRPLEATTTTTAPPPQPAVAVTPPSSWQVSWIVRCPPAPSVWYTYSGSLEQAQAIYNQQVALIGQPASPGCVYGSVSEIQQVG